MKPFVSFSIANRKEKNRLMNICLYFILLSGVSILIGTEMDSVIKWQIALNGMIVLGIFIISFAILKMMKRHEEIVLWQLMFFLIEIGYLMLERLDHTQATKQVMFYGIGAGIALIFPSIFSVVIKPGNKYFYLAILAVTMFLPFIFGDTILGATNWVSIGPISFQPSEIGKLALVLFLAATLAELKGEKNNYKKLIFPGIVVGISLLCLVAQRDLGATLLYYLTTLMMLLVVTESIVLPSLGLIAGGVGSILAYFMFGHVRGRVEAFLHPFENYNDSGYQVVQGLFAMGTWGWLGSGLTRGMPQMIPYAISDYIFPAVCEEFGIIIGVVVLLCYLGIIFLCLQVAFRYKHTFYQLIIIGIACLFGMQVFIIIGGVLKLLPLTGITTPFMSTGGTSIIVSMAMIGLITYFSYKARENNEKGETTNGR